jgi:hypothetical protein
MIEVMHSLAKFKATYRNTDRMKVGDICDVRGSNNNPEEISIVPATWESWTGVVIHTFSAEEEDESGMLKTERWAEIIYTPALLVTDMYDSSWKVGDTLYVNNGNLVKIKPDPNAHFCAKVVKKNKNFRLLFK